MHPLVSAWFSFPTKGTMMLPLHNKFTGLRYFNSSLILSLSHHCDMENQWKRPKHKYIKVNVKGGLDVSQCLASVSAVMRNEYGRYIDSYKGIIGFTTPIVAELYAILYGMDLAWGVHDRIIIESDSSEAIDLVNGVQGDSALGYELKIIDMWKAKKEWTVEFTLANKYQNEEARAVTVLALEEASVGVFDTEEPLRNMWKILQDAKME
ncbi:hypothetical protein POM88_018000 [Heracleum sosnowskyi]|uniref:RNase H type-1 domain-containing protein n=1 Tax=Heracleum sosnowskyi TaxID=360622 RepID=A0AAD8MYU2_9APIA|nr:hypothetical protein POM88_018000 [Heracleum sosnowskyi]